jgi:hypothetical protein
VAFGTIRGEAAVITWKGMSGTPILRHAGWIWSISFSPDGTRVATASEDGTARVWNADTFQPITPPLRHAHSVGTASFSRDGTRILTASGDAAQVWDARTGLRLTEAPEQDDRIVRAAFTPDGRGIETCSLNGTVHVWRLGLDLHDPPAWAPRLAEAVAGERVRNGSVLEPVPHRFEALAALRAMLAKMPANDRWVKWGRWVLADRATRAETPFQPKSARAVVLALPR